MKIICLTGKKNSGKSTLIDIISNNKNIKCFKTDEYIHSIYKKNEIGYKLINKSFGSIFNSDNGIDRSLLAEYVIDKNEYQKLINITNPLIYKWIENIKKDCKTDEFIIIELAIYLKFEKYFSNLFDKVILIEDLKDDCDNHVSFFLNHWKIKSDIKLQKFDDNNFNIIIKWLKTI